MERLDYDVKIEAIRDGRPVTLYARIKGERELIEPGDFISFGGCQQWFEARETVGQEVWTWTKCVPGNRVARAIEQPMIDVLYWEVLV